MQIVELFELIDEAFGRRRLLQQSPISPDVWELYLDPEPGDGREARRDLLLTVAGGSEPGLVANALREAVGTSGGQGKASPARLRAAEIAANGNSVVARLTLPELIHAVVPMSRWWQNLPAWLKIGKLTSFDNQFDETALNTSEGVEFYTFAATAGLVHLMTTRRGKKFADRMADRRRGGLRRRDGSGQVRRVITPEIAEMLAAFNELWAGGGELFFAPPPKAVVDHVYPNRRSALAVAQGRRAIKADASENLFRASTQGITWAVVDSGIDARHPCFAAPTSPTAPDTFSSRVYETYDFSRVRQLLSNPRGSVADRAVAKALLERLDRGLNIDWSLIQDQLRILHDANYRAPVQEHGTHVAGILGANSPATQDTPEVIGVCPDIRMLDIRVFDDSGETDEFTILSALQFLIYLNSLSSTPRVHGANLSFSLAHKVRSFACGSTPVCEACEGLVKARIVVVAAAGNAGYSGDSRNPTLDDRYATVSITDPGNAEAAITVGSTHKVSPMTYGVSYFSSRGPTGDGRRKPDLLAPGEKILSALPEGRFGEMDGTSMAAPHVSGAAAILLSRYPELRKTPAKVKEILCQSAFDLGREKAFQGAGLVDVLHALQAPWRND
jgi:serine protease AprX